MSERQLGKVSIVKAKGMHQATDNINSSKENRENLKN